MLPRSICYCQHVINDVHPKSKINIISFFEAIYSLKIYMFLESFSRRQFSFYNSLRQSYRGKTYPAPCGTVINLRLNALIGGLSDLLSAKKNWNLTNEDKYIYLNFIFMFRVFFLSKQVNREVTYFVQFSL